MTSLNNATWLARYHQTMLPLFNPTRVLVRGQGCYVWDADGQRYLDLFGGIAVNALGHAHPAWTAAIAQQLNTLGHISNLFASPPQIELAEQLATFFPPDADPQVFFTNSGTEAMEVAMKLALRTGRPRILALDGSFHGRSLGALALTSKEVYRKPFEPLPGNVEFLPFGDVEALAGAMAEDVAAIVVEVIQGEGGVNALPPTYLPQARRLADRYGTLLVVDEVQTGIGRTGTWLAHSNPELVNDPVLPDVVALAKGLGGGFPVGAAITLTPQAGRLLGPGEHGTTFGGNPLAAAASLATVNAIRQDELRQAATNIGRYLVEAILGLNHPGITAVRGAGLLRAVGLTRPIAPALAEAAAAAGFLVNAVAPDAIRLAPPLILTQAQAATFVQALPGLLDSLGDSGTL